MTIFHVINCIITTAWIVLFLREIKMLKELIKIVELARNELKEGGTDAGSV